MYTNSTTLSLWRLNSRSEKVVPLLIFRLIDEILWPAFRLFLAQILLLNLHKTFLVPFITKILLRAVIFSVFSKKSRLSIWLWIKKFTHWITYKGHSFIDITCHFQYEKKETIKMTKMLIFLTSNYDKRFESKNLSWRRRKHFKCIYVYFFIQNFTDITTICFQLITASEHLASLSSLLR